MASGMYGAVPGDEASLVSPSSPSSATGATPRRMSFDVEDRAAPGAGQRLGTFFGVFVPCISSMFGVVCFLRLSSIVGHAGFWGAFLIIMAGFVVCFLTMLSLCALITKGEVLSGGMYHAMRNSIGMEWGGVLGLVFYVTFVSRISFGLLGFAEMACYFLGIGDDNPKDLQPWEAPDTWINIAVASAGLLVVTIFALRGAKFSSQVSLLVFVFILLSIASSLVCLLVPTRQQGVYTAFSFDTFYKNAAPQLKEGTSKYSFFGLFVMFMPDFVGVVAGANLSGELRRAATSIPTGSLMALVVALLAFILIAFVEASCVDGRLLRAHQLLMETVSDSVTGLPVVFAGICCACLNMGLNFMVGGARMLQALGRDKYLPVLEFFEPNHMGSRGEPWRAIMFTWLLAQSFLFIGDVDHIAPVTGGAFLLMFACCNMACFVQTVAVRSFQPKFKWFSRWTSLLGALLCTIGFFVAATPLVLSVIAGLVGLIVYAKRHSVKGALQYVAQASAPRQMPEVEKLLLQSDVQKRVRRAAAFVRDALHGRFQSDEWSKEEEDAHRIAVKRFFHQLGFLRYLNIAVFLGISFVERPSWCYSRSCGDPKVVLMSGAPVLPVSVTILIELVCLFGFVCEMVLKAAYEGTAAFYKNKWHIAEVVLLLVDAAAILVTLVAPSSMPLMPLLRPLIFVCISRRVRRAATSLLRVLPSFLDCAFIIALLIGFWALFGMLLFQNTPEGRQYFPSISESYLSLFVMLTTANFPEIMMPSYSTSRLTSLYFISFLVVGVFFFMNLVLATIYHNYRKQCEENLALFRKRRQEALDVAFQLLDINGTGSLEFSVCQALLVELERPMVSIFDWRTSKVIGMERASNRLSILQENPTGGINKSMFSDLVSNVKLKIDQPGADGNAVPDRDSDLAAESCCSLFLGRGAQHALGRMVRNPLFEGAVDVMILINSVLIVIETEYEMTHATGSGIQILETVEPIFTLVYVVELLLKLVVYGWGEYWRKLRNRFDFFVVFFLMVAEVQMLFSTPTQGNQWHWIRYMLVFRLLRCLRLLVAVRRFNNIFATFLQLVPAFITLGGLLFALMAFYAEFGLRLFGGKLYVGNPQLQGLHYGKKAHYANNFNDFASAMVALFELLVVNQWDSLMEAVVAATSSWSRVFFITFYCSAAVVLLDLVVAFILEAFFEKEQEHEKITAAAVGGVDGAGGSYQATRGGAADQVVSGNAVSSQEFSLNSKPHFVTLEETL